MTKGKAMATTQEYETDGIGARWHNRRPGIVAVIAGVAVWQMATDIADEAIARGDIAADERPTFMHTVHERIVTADVREARALHSWFHGDVTTGDEDPMPSAPDAYTRQASQTVKRRTRKGTNVDEVKRHGRGYVVGSLTERPRDWQGPTLPHSASMSADRIRAALATASLTATGGHDAIMVGMLTDAIYPDLPRLTGADTVAWEESQGENILSSVRALAMPARTGDAPLGKIRQTPADGYVRFDHELLAPTDDGRVFVGHAAIIPPRETVRDRKARETAEREADRKTLNARIPLATAVAVLATGLERGTSLTWTHGRVSGSVSRSQSDRWSATVDGHDAIRSQRSVKGLARQLTQ